MTVNKPTAPQRDAPSVATLQTGSGQEGVYQTPDWSGRNAIEQGYYGSVWVMRSLQAIADTAAALPFRAGLDPDTPDQWNPNAPLTRLLGPASPQAPGGPNPVLTARAFWAWSVVQKLATGKMAWELQSDPSVRNWNGTGNQIVGLWPLVAYLVDPIPVFGQARYFSGYTYHGTDGDRNLTDQQVFYAWRMSQKDPRQPESLLQGCTLSVSIDVAINRYMWNLLNNGLVATHVVQSLPIDEPEMRRSWEEQFMARFTGFDNSGRVIFDYAENAEGGVKDTLQITPVATKPVDAQLLEIAAKAKTEVLVGLGVPESLIGNASQRIYANSDAEYRSFWTLRMLDIITELQDDVNTYLAPKLGPEVGWFDLSRVSALRPPSAFQPPALTDLLTAGVIGPQDVNNLLGLANDPDIDTSTVNLGELDSAQSPAGTTARADVMTRSLPFAHWEEGTVNTHTLRNGTAWRPVLDLPARSNVVTYNPVYTFPQPPVRSERAEAIVARVREVADRRSAKTAELAETPKPFGSPDGPGLWHHKGWKLPNYIEQVAHGLVDDGHPESEAIEIAIGTVRRWARGGGKVTPEVRAASAKAIAEFDALRSAAGGKGDKRSDVSVTEGSSAGDLLPVAPVPKVAAHRFAGADLAKCRVCGQSAKAKIHAPPRKAKGRRHRGPGHAHVPTGHTNTPERRRAAAKHDHKATLDTLEPQVADVVSRLFAQQHKAVLDRLNGNRGRQMVNRALKDMETRAPNEPPTPPDAGDGTQPPPQGPVVDPSAVFDPAHWAERTVDALNPSAAAVGQIGTARVRGQIGQPDVPPEADSLAQSQVANLLSQQVRDTADQVTSTTTKRLSQSLTEGVQAGESTAELAKRVTAVLGPEASKPRAEMIARTMVNSAMNAAAAEYASTLPPGIVGGKEWLAIHDHRTRHDHVEADGQTQQIGNPFVVGGYPMDHPGAPTAPPDQVCNCRCTVAYLPAPKSHSAALSAITAA